MIEINDIMALFNDAIALTGRVVELEEALSFATEIAQEPPLNPEWWWGFVPSKRRAQKVRHTSRKLLELAPREIETARNDLKKVEEQLNEKYGLQYRYSELSNGLLATLTRIGSDEVMAQAVGKRKRK